MTSQNLLPGTLVFDPITNPNGIEVFENNSLTACGNLVALRHSNQNSQYNTLSEKIYTWRDGTASLWQVKKDLPNAIHCTAKHEPNGVSLKYEKLEALFGFGRIVEIELPDFVWVHRGVQEVDVYLADNTRRPYRVFNGGIKAPDNIFYRVLYYTGDIEWYFATGIQRLPIPNVYPIETKYSTLALYAMENKNDLG